MINHLAPAPSAECPEESCSGPGLQRWQGRSIVLSWYHLPKLLPVTVPGYEFSKANFHLDSLAPRWEKKLGHISSYENTDWLENHEFILIVGVKWQKTGNSRAQWCLGTASVQLSDISTETKPWFIVRRVLTTTDKCNWFFFQVNTGSSVWPRWNCWLIYHLMRFSNILFQSCSVFQKYCKEYTVLFLACFQSNAANFHMGYITTNLLKSKRREFTRAVANYTQKRL